MADEARGRRQVWRGGFRTKAEAAAAERRFLVELEPADAPARPSMTVEAFLTDWLVQSASTRRATTSMSYESVIATRLVPHLGHLDLRELAPPRRWGSGLLSPTTVRMTHCVLRRAMQDALRWELVDRNPCDAVVAPRRASVEMRAWTPEEVRRFLAHVADDRLAAMWRLFVATGMRRGEVAGLRWVDVDLDAGRLAVRSTRVLVYAEVQVAEPKSKRSRRVVALDQGTVDALRWHREAQDSERRAAGALWEESGYVFVREDGRPFDPDRISHLSRVR